MRPSSEGTAPGWTERAAVWLGLAALLLLSRPFPGLFHDGYLYAAQVLHRLGEGELGRDLIFVHGNQDSFTFFTRLYAPVVAALGLSGATLAAWITAMALWLAGLAALARAIFTDRPARYLAMSAVLLLAPNYGNGVLSYGEPFITSRPFAEALGMFALAAAMRRLLLPCVALVALCGLIHPLTGIGVAAVCLWLCATSPRQFLLFAAGGLVLALGLAVVGGQPFSWLLQSVDATWFSLMKAQSALVFVTTWGGAGAAVLALPLTTLILILRRGEARQARLARAVLIVGGLLAAVSLVTADLLGNRLIVMLQLWRGLLWVTLAGNLLAVQAFGLLPSRSLPRRLLGLALVLNVVEHLLGQMPVFSAAMAGLVLASLALQRVLSPGMFRWGGAALAVLATLVGLAALVQIIGKLGLPANLTPVLRIGLIALALVPLAGRTRPFLSGGAVLLALGGALLLADGRGDRQRALDGVAELPLETASTLSGKQVYWEGGLDILWYRLQQPQFYSCRQKAGSLFFRDQALAFARRAQVLRTLNTTDFDDEPGGVCPTKQTPGATGPETVDQLRYVCENLPELDLMVLRRSVPSHVARTWIVMSWQEGREGARGGQRFYVYDCERLRF